MDIAFREVELTSRSLKFSETDFDERVCEMGMHVRQMLKRFESARNSSVHRPHDALNQQELRVIEFLGSDGQQIMRALAEYLSLAVNSVTTIVDGLVRKKLVSRNRSTTDRRLVFVELTQVGRKIWMAVEESKLELYRSILSPLDSGEQAIFLDLLRKIAQVDAQPDSR